MTSTKHLDEDNNFNWFYEITILSKFYWIFASLSICFPDDVVEAYNLIKDLEPTTPQVTYIPLD